MSTIRNAKKRSSLSKPKDRRIRVAIIGVGNVASVLVQALLSETLPEGIWHPRVGGHSVRDIEVVAAFDIDKNKVGRDLSEAILAKPNVSLEYTARFRRSGVVVRPGLVGSDVPFHLRESTIQGSSISESLKESGADLALLLIPSGMQESCEAYADECFGAGVSLVNATPSVLATSRDLTRKFSRAKLLLLGDDLMSQFGGTAFHKGILDFMNSRGLKIEKSYQLDVGGGTETLNTITEEIRAEKRNIKSQAIAVEIPYKFETVAGTTDYVDYMGNNRTSYFWLQAKSFFGAETQVDVYLRTNDGANAANVLFDVIRAAAYSKAIQIYGSPSEICDYGFKKTQEPCLLKDAHEEFYKKYAK